MAREACEERLRALAADYDQEVRLAQQRGEENARGEERYSSGHIANLICFS